MLSQNSSAQLSGTINVNLTEYGGYGLNITSRDKYGNNNSVVYNFVLNLVSGGETGGIVTPPIQDISLNETEVKIGNKTLQDYIDEALKDIRNKPVEEWGGFAVIGVIILIFMLIGMLKNRRG